MQRVVNLVKNDPHESQRQTAAARGRGDRRYSIDRARVELEAGTWNDRAALRASNCIVYPVSVTVCGRNRLILKGTER